MGKKKEAKRLLRQVREMNNRTTALSRENTRLEDLNRSLTAKVNGLDRQLSQYQERNDWQAQKIRNLDLELATANRNVQEQSTRIGQLAASNFGLRLRAKTAERRLEKILKLKRNSVDFDDDYDG